MLHVFPLVPTPPLHQAISAATAELRPRRAAPPLLPTAAQPSLPLPLGSIGPSRAACCPGRAIPVVGAEPPRRPPAALAVRPRWRLLRPNFGHPQALGERVVEPHYLPGRERRRLRRNPAGAATSPCQDPIASPEIFPGSQP
jgi:hypothetical protein